MAEQLKELLDIWEWNQAQKVRELIHRNVIYLVNKRYVQSGL